MGLNSSSPSAGVCQKEVDQRDGQRGQASFKQQQAGPTLTQLQAVEPESALSTPATSAVALSRQSKTARDEFKFGASAPQSRRPTVAGLAGAQSARPRISPAPDQAACCPICCPAVPPPHPSERTQCASACPDCCARCRSTPPRWSLASVRPNYQALANVAGPPPWSGACGEGVPNGESFSRSSDLAASFLLRDNCADNTLSGRPFIGRQVGASEKPQRAPPPTPNVSRASSLHAEANKPSSERTDESKQKYSSPPPSDSGGKTLTGDLGGQVEGSATGGVARCERAEQHADGNGVNLGGGQSSATKSQTALEVSAQQPAPTNQKSPEKSSEDTKPTSKLKTEPTAQHRDQKPQRPSWLGWNDLTLKYGKMARTGELKQPLAQHPRAQPNLTSHSSPAGLQDERIQTGGLKRGGLSNSCLCHVFCALLQTAFPIIASLKNYSLPGDLLSDLAAGFTVGVLHIPQGMAYGLLSGVEPIHGLYVSFVPVLIMAFMSKTRHVSYGTFAIISMMLVNTATEVRSNLRNEHALLSTANGSARPPVLVITNNHQPLQTMRQRDLLLRQLTEGPVDSVADDGQSTESGLLEAAELGPGSFASGMHVPSNIEILACACLVCGAMHVSMSLLRLGVLSLLFSDQLVSSFTTAGAILVLTSQLETLFDLSLAPMEGELFKCVRVWWQFAQVLAHEHVNWTTATLSLVSILFLVAVKDLVEPRLRRKFAWLPCLPTELVLMGVVICCSNRLEFAQRGVRIIGPVATGLPELRPPNLDLVPYVLKDSLGIALITFAYNFSIAQVYARKFRYELDANQELFALGSSNLVSSFFSCFPCASSLSRSSVQSTLNVKSQLCSVFSCGVVVLIICYFAHILHDLPRSTLSCIIVVALKGILMQVRDFRANWRLSKSDAIVWGATFMAVIAFGVTLGLAVGIAVSLVVVFLRLLTPNHSLLARLPGTEIYIDKDAFADCEEVDQVKVFRCNSALCYLNRAALKSQIERLLPAAFEPRGFQALCARLHGQPARAIEGSSNTSTRFLVLDCSTLSYCDFSGLEMLLELIVDLADRKVTVYLAACPLRLIHMIERIPAGAGVLSSSVFPTVGDAVGHISYLQEASVFVTGGKSRAASDSSSRASRDRSSPIVP